MVNTWKLQKYNWSENDKLNWRFQKENLENLSKNKMCNFIWNVKDNDPLPKHRLPQKKKIQSTYRIVQWTKIVNISMCDVVEKES